MSTEITPGTDAGRRRRKRRPVYVAAAAVCVIAVGALLFMGLRGNIVYFKTVSEAVAERESLGTDRFRIAGAVVPGTVAQTSNGVRFDVTDGDETVTVRHTGDPPDLFKDGAPVLSEGRFGPGEVFVSDRILIKHGASYEPPAVETEKSEGRSDGT